MDKILSTIGSPSDLQKLSQQELTQLAVDIREAAFLLGSERLAGGRVGFGQTVHGQLVSAFHGSDPVGRCRGIHEKIPVTMPSDRISRISHRMPGPVQ